MLAVLALIACGPVETVVEPSDAVDNGAIFTLTIDGTVLGSLPEAPPEVGADERALGRLLFWDPVLSGDQDVACATCHLPEFDYSDGLERSIGVGGQGHGPDRVGGMDVPRNSLTVLNTAFNGIDEVGAVPSDGGPMFWDSRVTGLVEQAAAPVHSLVEMRGEQIADEDIEQVVVERLRRIPAYVDAFADVYGGEPITFAQITQSIATYERSLVANNSPFDRWMRGDANAMSPNELEGMVDFVEVGCAECHSGPMFSDSEHHVLGLPDPAGLAEPDLGDGNHGFRTPSLRQLSATGPYFHAGQAETLDDVLDFYDAVGDDGRGNGGLRPTLPQRELSEELRDLGNLNGGRSGRIEDFLRTLTDDDFDRTQPDSVPSGLPVGGR